MHKNCIYIFYSILLLWRKHVCQKGVICLITNFWQIAQHVNCNKSRQKCIFLSYVLFKWKKPSNIKKNAKIMFRNYVFLLNVKKMAGTDLPPDQWFPYSLYLCKMVKERILQSGNNCNHHILLLNDKLK